LLRPEPKRMGVGAAWRIRARWFGRSGSQDREKPSHDKRFRLAVNRESSGRRSEDVAIGGAVCMFTVWPYLLHTVAAMLPSPTLARLQMCCKDSLEQVGTKDHILRLFKERGDSLPGLARLQHAGIVTPQVLEELYFAEVPSPEAVLCIFDFASVEPEFDEETVATMKQFAEALAEHPKLQLRIVGHGQPGAPEPLASNLAMQRAEEVKLQFMSAHGICSQRMQVTHCSNKMPRFRDPDKNRRVELSVVLSSRRVVLQPISFEPEWAVADDFRTRIANF